MPIVLIDDDVSEKLLILENKIKLEYSQKMIN